MSILFFDLIWKGIAAHESFRLLVHSPVRFLVPGRACAAGAHVDISPDLFAAFLKLLRLPALSS